jgi:hypothetical protein
MSYVLNGTVILVKERTVLGPNQFGQHCTMENKNLDGSPDRLVSIFHSQDNFGAIHNPGADHQTSSR